MKFRGSGSSRSATSFSSKSCGCASTKSAVFAQHGPGEAGTEGRLRVLAERLVYGGIGLVLPGHRGREPLLVCGIESAVLQTADTRRMAFVLGRPAAQVSVARTGCPKDSGRLHVDRMAEKLADLFGCVLRRRGCRHQHRDGRRGREPDVLDHGFSSVAHQMRLHLPTEIQGVFPGSSRPSM